MSTRWSYKVVQVKPTMLKGLTPERIEEELRALGNQGWELVSVTGVASAWQTVLMYFKKPQ